MPSPGAGRPHSASPPFSASSPFIADLHIHSRYSRACSRDCDLEHLAWWARRKGITLVGTGDFTHPAWYQHLRDLLVPAEPGLYRLRPDLDAAVVERLPGSVHAPVRFMLSVEISTIYKRDGRTRKVHHLIYLPDLEAAARFNARLGRIGNLGSDGRPIIGLDSRDLLEITLEASPDGYLVPAHAWTPWFSVLGSRSGFDAVADCYADLAGHVFALETGLSSDPAMNWQVSSLDRYTLVSNSDAHSPPALGREASAFSCALDYYAVRDALRTRDGFAGTVEFFPEEGKYHADGHRRCELRCDPEQTRAYGGRCPTCGRPLTVGVLSRVSELADRPAGTRPPGAAPYRNLVPLPEIVGEILGVGAKSKAVGRQVDILVARLGPELSILSEVPVEDIGRAGPPLLAEAIGRLRRGEVLREAGYDGEYGVIRLFDPAELRRPAGVAPLFELPAPAPLPLPAPLPPPPARQLQGSWGFAAPTTGKLSMSGFAQPVLVQGGLLDRLDPEQRAAAALTSGPVLVVAGPGTGKTRTLTHRIAHLVADHATPPQHCLAITFTRRAAAELAARLAVLVPEQAPAIAVTTFHGLGARILREQHARVGLSAAFRVADEGDRLAVLQEVTGGAKQARRALHGLTRARRQGAMPGALRGAQPGALPGAEPGGLPGDLPGEPAGAVPDELADVAAAYAKTLRAWDLVDFDDLLSLPVTLLEGDPVLAAGYRARWTQVSVDEYQDVDGTQYRLLRLLVPPDGNLLAIGDPDQAIYSFRGADVGYFLRFAADYPGARTVRLGRNYRSTPSIVQAAVQAVAPTSLVPGRSLVPVQQGQAPPVGLYAASDERDEAAFVARTIDRLLGGSSFHSLDSDRVDGREQTDRGGLGFADVAVLYRTDAQSQVLLEAFTRAGVPFQKRSHDRLADRPGVQAVVRELRFRDAGGPGTLPDRVRRVARELADRIPRGFAAGAADAGAGALPAGGHAAELYQAADLLLPLAGRCGGDRARFFAELELDVEVDALDLRADKVSLLTLHAAKGLEFPVVFCVGLEDGLLPLRLPGEHALPDAEVAEERRLLFVGITRARSRLYLSHAGRRTRHGADRPARPSPFLAAINPALLESLNDAAPRKPKPQQARLF